MQVTTMRWLVRLGFLVVILLAGLPRLSRGQTAPTPAIPPANARALRAVGTLPASNLTAAEKALTAAYRQTPNVELLFQLGQLAAAQEQLLLAQDLMRRYLNDPAANLDPTKVTLAQKILARPRPPSGKIRVQGDRGGLVLLDGRLLGRLPLVQPLLAAPGPRTVAIQYPGKLLDVQVEVVAGRMIDIQCTRATGAIFFATPPALLLLAELPELPSALSEQLLDAVERAAQRRQLTILKPEALLTLSPELKSLPAPRAEAELKQCLAEPACLQRLLQKAKLDYALRIRATIADVVTENKVPNPAEVAPPKQWEFTTELLHVSILGAASAQTQRCAVCVEQRAAAALQEAVSRTLTTGLTRPPGTLTVSSDPAGAEVWLGDRMLGQTPLTLATWAGEYTLELRQSGYVSVRRNVAVEAKKTVEVAASLPPSNTQDTQDMQDAPPSPPTVPPAPPPVPPAALPPVPLHWERGPRPRWRLTIGASTLLAGVSVTLLGVLALKISADSFCPPMFDPMKPLPSCNLNGITLQRNLGIGATAIGSAFMITGVGLLIWPGSWRLVR